MSAFALVCALASVSVLGCGGSPAPQDPSQLGALDLVSLLPPDAAGVVHMDIAALRSAPFMARLDEAMAPYMNEQSTNVRELMNRVDRVAIAFRHEATDEAGEPLLVVARGRFSVADMQTFAPSLTPGTHREHALRRDETTVLALAHEHTLAFGTHRWVAAALDRLDGLSPPAGPSSAVLADAAQRVQLGQHSITYASEVPESFHLAGMLPVNGNAVSLGGWVDLGEPIQMQAFGLFTDSESAAAVAAELRAKIAEGEQSPELATAGFDRLFTSVNIVASGSEVDVTYSIDNETMERVILAVLVGLQAFSSAAFSSAAAAAGEESAEESGISDVHVQP